MKIQNQVRFGIITSFNDQRCDGWMRINGDPQEAKFSLDSQRELIEGASEPVFGPVGSKRFPMPSRGAQVAVEIEIGYIPEFVPNIRRGLRRAVDIIAWDYRFRHQDILGRIANRQVYEVVEFTLIRETPVSGPGQRRVIATGTALELERDFPRSSALDPLAPEIQTLDITTRRRFYEKRKGDTSVQVPDSRPLPAGAIAVLPPPVNEFGQLLASASQLSKLKPVTVGRPASSRARVTV